MSALVYLGLGTNLGNREENVRRAVQLLGERVGQVGRLSSLYVTEPWGFRSDNLFVNAAVSVRTALSPRQLLEATQRIERDMGRTEKSDGGDYRDRVIDIDILLYGSLRVSEPGLVIPHPLMYERDFVTKPLNEILGGLPPAALTD